MQLGDYRVTGVDDGSTDFLANIDTKKTEKKRSGFNWNANKNTTEKTQFRKNCKVS